ncbi:MAG: DUF3108 domain-containing protein, partial [Muribaculaceae bacterium]|nr:DUF3108 domain-containing protein [Muribaculaceae bacterium]
MSKGVYKGFEEVETPAGKFNCVKVEFQRKEAMGGPVVTNNITRWYAQGIGMVKMISADKKGKINAETVLCEISE